MFSIRFLTIALVATLASEFSQAHPTERPLPPGTPSEEGGFLLMRDHEVANRIYALPTVLKIVENELIATTSSAEPCAVVDNFLEAQSTLAKSLLTLSKLNQRRAELLLAQLDTAEKGKTLLAKNLEKQEKLKELTNNPEVFSSLGADEQAKALRELDQLVAESKVLASLTTSNQDAFKTLDESITQSNSNIKLLQTSLDGLKEKVMVPAARLKLRLSMEESFKALENALRQQNLQVVLPELVGLSLSPRNEGVANKALYGESERSTDLASRWSADSFEHSEEAFGLQELPKNTKLEPFPRNLTFEKVVSLPTYCELKKFSVNNSDPYIDTRVRFSVPLFQDEKLKGSQVLGALSFRVPGQFVKNLKERVERKTTELSLIDQGRPELFSGSGFFKHKEYEPKLIMERGKNEN